MKKIMKYKGFTLAETLITLVIIGIVAALTVPNLINNHRREFVETRLKSAYSILTNMFKAAEVDYGPFASWDMSELSKETEVASNNELIAPFVDKYMRPYLRIADDKYVTFQDFGYKKLLYPDGTDFHQAVTSRARFITLANGMTFWFGLNGFKLSNGNTITIFYIRIFVDVDGPGKGPSTIGKDIFIFYQPFVKDFPLAMFGEQNTNSCTYREYLTPQTIQYLIERDKCTFFVNLDTGVITYTNIRNTREQILEHCKSAQGYNGPTECGALIKMDGWRISKDYPWL